MSTPERVAVIVARDTRQELKAIAVDFERAERRRVPLGDVVRRLVEAWKATAGPERRQSDGME